LLLLATILGFAWSISRHMLHQIVALVNKQQFQKAKAA